MTSPEPRAVAMDGLVRAIVMKAPGLAALEDRAAMPAGPGDAVVRILATGVCGSDIHGLAGDTGRREPGQVMGHETVGRVVEVGTASDNGWLGALVTVNPVVSCGGCDACRRGEEEQCESSWVLGVRTDVDAAFAERMTVPARNLVRLPETMTEWHGALIEPLAVGYHAASRGGTRESDRVLVIGGGPIGQAAALGARRRGAQRILVSEPDALRAEIVQRLGFPVASPGDLPERVRQELGGPPSLVIDAVANSTTLGSALESSMVGARIVLVGMAAPELAVTAYGVSAAERTLIGSFCYSARHFEDTAEWVARHPDEVEIVGDLRVRLDEGADVFTRLAAGDVLGNKVLIMP